MGTEIPLWIGGFQKWVTGVNKHTTCDDIVKAVLASNDTGKEHRHRRDNRSYTIVERWRKVERPLDSKSRILKVWKTWGDEQCNVRFLMKKVHHHPNAKDYRTHRRKQLKIVSRHSNKLSTHAQQDADDGDVKISKEYNELSIEDLRKLIHRQNETLSEQLKNLEQKDDEIDYYETKIHFMRMRQIGTNYVQDTYLGDNEDEESTPSDVNSCDSIQQVIEMYEKLLDACRMIENKERTIEEMASKIKTLNEHKDHICSLDENIERIRQRLDELFSIVDKQGNMLRENEQTLAEINRTLYERNVHIQALQTDLENLESETLRLEQEYDVVHGLQLENTIIKTKSCDVTNEAADSNSDTGLSSLHSSSEDCVIVLDTLV